jgi:hypothetical protein
MTQLLGLAVFHVPMSIYLHVHGVDNLQSHSLVGRLQNGAVLTMNI